MLIAPIDIFQDNAQEVREDTAELASWALSDKPSFANGHSPRRQLLSPTLLSNNDAAPNGQNALEQRRSEESFRPDAIPEVSEPASPSSIPSPRKSPGTSALSELFKSSPPTEEEDADADDEEQSGGSSDVGAVTVQEGIISQPTEQTALLLRKQVHGFKASHHHSYLGDLESQKDGQVTITERRMGRILAATAGHGKMTITKILNPKAWEIKVVWDQGLLKPASYIPAVILGLLLNILDALSYG